MMGRKPNYRFERKERERLKAEKSAAKARLKLEQKDGEPAAPDDDVPPRTSDQGTSG